MRTVLVALWALPAIFGQALRLAPVPSRDGHITIQIIWDAPAGKVPVALQWETIFPAQRLSMDSGPPQAAPAVTQSGKSLQCAGRKKTPELYAYRCILAGGQKPVPNGPIAVLHFKLLPARSRGPAKIQVAAAQGVTADLKKIAIRGTEAKVQ